MQIMPNLFLVNGFPYSQHQNSYILKFGSEFVMIDSGDSDFTLTESFDLVRRNCAVWGIRLEKISCLLLTHAHFDHTSHAARLRKMGVKIVANQDCADALESGDDRCIGYALHRTIEPCKVDRIVKDGEDIEIGDHKIRCIETPGHANSCVVYETVMNDQRLWFVGDVIMIGSECQTIDLGWNGGPDFNRKTYLETLRKMAHMECDCLLSGHGPPCIGYGKKLVEMAYMKAMMTWR